jgi:molybdenum cofactor cytidylyltransferase
MNAPSIAAVVPAAGRAARFGGRKLLADVGGAPLLQRTLASLLQAGIDRVVLVTRDGASFDGVPGLDDPRVTTVTNHDPDRGMFSSIQAGLAATAGDAPVLVLPADMPFVAAATIAAVAAHAITTDAVVIPTHGGQRGHPIALPARLRDGLLGRDPSISLKAALADLDAPIALVAVADPGILHDVDTPADLAR